MTYYHNFFTTIIPVCFLFSGSILQAQSFEWKQTDSVVTYSQGSFVKHDAQGNIYIVVNQWWHSYDTGKVAIIKYDPEGNKKWSFTYPDSTIYRGGISGMTTTAAGYTYAVGSISFTENGPFHAFVFKLSPSGNLVWNQEYSDYNDNGIYHALEIDTAENLFVTGSASIKMVTSKLDSSGNYTWTKISSLAAYGAAIAMDEQSNIIVIASKQDDTMEVIKYSGAGDLIWNAEIASDRLRNGYPQLVCLKTDHNNNALLSYFFYSWNSGDVLSVQAQVSTNGLVSWTKIDSGFNTSYTDLAIDEDNNAYFAGYSYDSSSSGVLLKLSSAGDTVWFKKYDGLKNEGAFFLNMELKNHFIYLCGVTIDNVTGYDLLTTKADENGNIMWAVYYDNPNSSDRANDVTVDDNDNVIVTGSINDQFAQNSRVITLKYQDTTFTAVTVISSTQSYPIMIFPNPVHDGIVFLEWSEMSSSGILVTVYNEMGMEIMNKEFSPFLKILPVDVSKLTPGNYFVKVINEERTEVKKLVIQ